MVRIARMARLGLEVWGGWAGRKRGSVDDVECRSCGLRDHWPDRRCGNHHHRWLHSRVSQAWEDLRPGRWRKLKGTAMVRLPDGIVARAEVHWYEAHGLGRKEVRIK